MRARTAILILVAVFALAIGVIVERRVLRPMFFTRAVERILRESAPLQELAKSDPAAYERTRREALREARYGISPVKIQALIRSNVLDAALKYMPTASDDAILAFWRLNAQEIRIIAAKDAKIEYAVLYRGVKNVDARKYLDESFGERELAATADVIRTGAASEPQFRDYARAEQHVAAIIKDMFDEFGRDAELFLNHGLYMPDPALTRYTHDREGNPIVVQETPGPPDKKRACEMAAQFVERILQLPPSEAADVFRYLAVHTR